MDDTALADEQRAVLARVRELESEAARLYACGVRARYDLVCRWDLAEGPNDFGIIELAGTARIGQTRACTQLTDAGRLVEVFRGTLASLEAGRMSVHMCELLLSLTRSCSEAVQAGVEARLLGQLEVLNTTDGRRRICETILEVEADLDPDAAAQREARAKAARDVYVQPVQDGMCLVSALLDNLTARRWALDFDELVRAQAAVDKADGIVRSRAQRRADVFAALPSQLLALLQMIAAGDLTTLQDLARRDPQAAEQVQDLADQTQDLFTTRETTTDPATADPATADPATDQAALGAPSEAEGASAYELTLALLRLKVRDPRVLNVHVAMETLLDLDQRAGWLEDVGPVSPYRARCLLPTAPLRRVLTDARSGQPLRIDQLVLPPPHLIGQSTLDAATLRQRLLTLLEPTVLIDETQDTHDPHQALRELLALRDRTCTGIGCTRPARLCDDDHEKSWPDGPTAEWNLSNKSRRCHLAKHHGWTVIRDVRNTTTWTSPLGSEYTRPSPWRAPTRLPDDLTLPEPRLVTDAPTTPDEPPEQLRDRTPDRPLATAIPHRVTTPEPEPLNLVDWDPYAPF